MAELDAKEPNARGAVRGPGLGCGGGTGLGIA